MTKRRCEIIRVDLTYLTELIQPCFTGQTVVDYQLMSEGLINTNYKIFLSNHNNPFLLRIYARDPYACQLEQDIFRLIKPTVPVPEVIYSGLMNSPNSEPYSILEWCEGLLLHDVLASGTSSDRDSVLLAAGMALFKIGEYTFSESGFFGPGLTIKQPFGNDPTSFMRRSLDDPRVRKRLGIELYEQVSTFISVNASCLKLSTKNSLVHSDFNSKNILVKQSNGQWLISAVLDWEWAHAGTQLFDIGSMLRYQSKYPDMESPFIEGYYCAGGKLPENWKQIVRFLDFNNLLEFLSGKEERQWLFDDAKQLITQTIAEWDGLILST